MANSKQYSIESQRVTIKDSVIKNLNYPFFDDLIVFYNIKASVPYKIILENITFEGIKFERGGNLMKLSHQQDDFLEINHCTFNNITNGGINVVSFFSSLAATLKTKVKMFNITTNRFEAQDTRFILLGEGAHVEVYNSTLKTISSLRIGGVVYAGSKQAVVKIYDSTFLNNTALEGGVFSSESESYIMCTR